VEEELEARCCMRTAPAHGLLSKLRKGRMARRDAMVGGMTSRGAIGVYVRGIGVSW